ncbi:MAG: heavy metal translocating P-type ATPase, partial [Paracoccaceae bacterium]
MTCCGTLGAPGGFSPNDDPRRAPQRADEAGAAGAPRQILLSAPTISCGRCIAAVEDTLNACEDVARARVNLTLRRISVTSAGPAATPARLIAALEARGYPATLIEPTATRDEAETRATASLLRAVAVAGFGAANIMLLSVAVWAGADGPMRDIFHFLSALIALPVAAYAGRPFYGSAFTALRARRLNMDVPITLGVLLALGLSLFELAHGGEEVFFDAAVTLLFFLLIGRYLDRLMRDRARSAVGDLARIGAKNAMRLNPDGTTTPIAVDMIEAGQRLRVAAGERMPVDAVILAGATDLDRSIVTGESAPVAAGPGLEVEAGALNLTGPLDICALRPASDSFLAQMLQMLQAAEAGRGRYVRIADRAARLYAPVVHLLAAATFIGWMLATDGDWRVSIFTAISVLIITCPCALGLAVPVVHVIAAGRLFRQGVMMKDGSALERLAEIDHVVFDKTGTLTTGEPRVVSQPPRRLADRAAARSLALNSAHPASKAIAAWLDAAPKPATEN